MLTLLMTFLPAFLTTVTVVAVSLPTNYAHNESDVFIRDYELEPYLRKITPTAPGLDALPSWLFDKNVLMSWQV